jgi:hypothetical protein
MMMVKLLVSFLRWAPEWDAPLSRREGLRPP